MKRVSFKIAKAIKEAGYPQEELSDWYDTINTNGESERFAKPTYLEVWLWLWREKGVKLSIVPTSLEYIVIYLGFEPIYGMNENVKDLEEAIIVAIKHLVDNKLLK